MYILLMGPPGAGGNFLRGDIEGFYGTTCGG